MSIGTIEELKAKKCLPCEGGVPLVAPEEALRLVKEFGGLDADARRPADSSRADCQALHGGDGVLQSRRANR